MIGDEVEITVVDIRGDKVRLGITAPRHIQVHRKEVYEAIKRENQQAAKVSTDDVAGVIPKSDAQHKRIDNRPAPTPPRENKKNDRQEDNNL
jgi:carbon storage regulator